MDLVLWITKVFERLDVVTRYDGLEFGRAFGLKLVLAIQVRLSRLIFLGVFGTSKMVSFCDDKQIPIGGSLNPLHIKTLVIVQNVLHGNAVFTCHEVDEQNMHSHVLAFKNHNNLGHPLVLLGNFSDLSDGALAEPELALEHEVIFVEVEQFKDAAVRVRRLLRQMDVHIEGEQKHESILALELLHEAVFDHELLRELEFELVRVQLVVRRLEWFLTADLVDRIPVLVSLYDVELPEIEAVEGLLHLVLLGLLSHFGRVHGQVHAVELVNVRVVVLRLMLGIETPSRVELQRGRLLLARSRVLWHLTLLIDPNKRIGAESFNADHSAQRVCRFQPLFARAERRHNQILGLRQIEHTFRDNTHRRIMNIVNAHELERRQRYLLGGDVLHGLQMHLALVEQHENLPVPEGVERDELDPVVVGVVLLAHDEVVDGDPLTLKLPDLRPHFLVQGVEVLDVLRGEVHALVLDGGAVEAASEIGDQSVLEIHTEIDPVNELVELMDELGDLPVNLVSPRKSNVAPPELARHLLHQKLDPIIRELDLLGHSEWELLLL